MKIKKLITCIIILFILSLIVFSNYSSALYIPMYSDAVILIEKDSGKILYSHDANTKMYPASTTKILTAILAIENLSLEEKLTASYEAVMSIPSGYSNAAIQVGESLTVKELLEVFLVHSANEAGYILAENISGSFSAFANLMNQKASELGCQNTHFTNPSGLHDENHYSTAYDLAQIARYCMKNETFRSIVSMPSCKIAATDKYEERYFRNTNEMLNSKSQYYNENVIGIKTGYTSQAQNCLISAIQKNGIELISVVLSAPASAGENGLSGKYTDTQTLFDYGIENYGYQSIIKSGDIVTQVEIKNASEEAKNLDLIAETSIDVFAHNTSSLTSDPVIEINENLSAPITANTVVGKVIYKVDGTSYATNLLAKNDVSPSVYLVNILKIVFGIVILIIVFELMYSKKNKRKKKKKKSGKKSNDNYLYGRVKY